MRDVTLRALLAAEGGVVSVERFMWEALYHPEHGYYTRRVNAVGRKGDFSTAATLGDALGRAVAAWAARHRGGVSRRGRWHLIELGGGSGELAAQVRRSLPWWTRIGLRYHLVEVSAGLRAAQQQRLAGERNVRWHTQIDAALDAAGGRALIFSNEFVDAFPCVQLVRDGRSDRWREVCLTWPARAERLEEALRDRDDSAAATATGGQLPPVADQRVEIHLAYQRWLAGWQPRWHAGRLLTIDYGDVLPTLYHRRPKGTLRAYCRHQIFTGPEVYARFGQQDLTVDVNFSDLIAWGEALGLSTAGFCTQAEFLGRWLRGGDRQSAPDRLCDPAGAGGAFKVLEQVRDARQNAA